MHLEPDLQVVPETERRRVASRPHFPVPFSPAFEGRGLSAIVQPCGGRGPGQGLVSDRLHIIEATDMAAKVDLFRLKQEHRDGDDDHQYVDRNSPNPDARFSRKRKKKGIYGYKAHIVEDADSELIVGVKTTPGNIPDGAVLPELIDAHPREATSDKEYDSTTNHAHLAELGVASGIIRRQRRPGRPQNSRRERPEIERKFAEGKQHHGLKKARYWGLAKVSIQNLMVALVVNLKRLVKLILPGQANLQPAFTA